MTRSGPQGPGWWQASDGNWYPPESRPGYPPPPPPAPAPSGPQPQSWSAPSPYGQNPGYTAYTGPTPGYGPPTANRQPTQTALPVRLIYSGISLGLLMNVRNIKSHPGDLSAAGVLAVMIFVGVVYGVLALLAYRAYKQLPAKVGALIGLTVVAGIIVIGDIVGLAMPGESAESPIDFLADIADVVTVIGIIMLWYGRSKSAPQQY
jgi:hypothetical protein